MYGREREGTLIILSIPATALLIPHYLISLHEHRASDIGEHWSGKLDAAVPIHQILKFHQILCLKLEVQLSVNNLSNYIIRSNYVHSFPNIIY